MGDYYTEQLVKRKSPGIAKVLKALLIAITVLALLMVLFIPVALIIAVILVIVDFFLFQRMDLEFEYLYVNGNLDIDKIMSKSRRKKVFEMEISELEVIAPAGAPELRPYQGVKTFNFGSGMPNAKVYEMIVVQNGDKKKIIFEPNEVILDGMRMLAPRKVFR